VGAAPVVYDDLPTRHTIYVKVQHHRFRTEVRPIGKLGRQPQRRPGLAGHRRIKVEGLNTTALEKHRHDGRNPVIGTRTNRLPPTGTGLIDLGGALALVARELAHLGGPASLETSGRQLSGALAASIAASVGGTQSAKAHVVPARPIGRLGEQPQVASNEVGTALGEREGSGAAVTQATGLRTGGFALLGAFGDLLPGSLDELLESLGLRQSLYTTVAGTLGPSISGEQHRGGNDNRYQCLAQTHQTCSLPAASPTTRTIGPEPALCP